jgi:class 3 adenylate cyclase
VFISSAAITLTAVGLLGAVGFLVLILALQRRWFSRFTHGLFLSVALAVALTAIGSALFVGEWGFSTARDSVDTEVTRSLENVAAIVDGQVRVEIRQMERTLQQLAGSLGSGIARADAADLRNRLRAVQTYAPRYLQLRVVTAHSDVLASSDDQVPEPLNRIAVAYALDGKTYVSESFSSKAYAREVVILAVPVKDDGGRIPAVVTAVFDIQGMLAELVSSSRFNASGYAIVVDSEGDVIAHPDRSQIGRNVQSYDAVHRAWASRGSGAVIGRNDAGIERKFFYRPIASPATTARQPWVILSEIDQSEELSVLARLRRQLFAAIAVAFVLALLVAQQVAASVQRPLEALKQFAARLGAGDLQARTDVSGRDVAGSLAASMDGMAAGLRERDRVKEVFGRYIATQVSDRILNGDVNLGGESRVVTVLFSDIRNFTTMAEQMSPQQVVSFLNAYFSEMVDAVFEQGGVLDKFLGDGLMAVFGSLEDQPDHAARAVRAALRMKALLGKMNAERAVAGLPPVAIGVGIHTAEVIVGNIGSSRRLEYTVVGDGVNTSSRVQALNKEFGTTILVTEDTYAALGSEFECRPMPATTLRGKHRPMQCYEVISARAAVAAV